MSSARITSFLVKVASRCNLDCDYCYVYHHADQSWRNMPKLLSDEHLRIFGERLAEYARGQSLKRLSVIIHGGEPLLAGPGRIVAFARDLRWTVGSEVELDVGLQTNGLLLTEEALDAFEAERIAVSLSMDGPRSAHDLHRTTRRGRSSFDRVEAALERLKRRPSIFAGVIAVVDATVPAETLLSYFAGHGVPKVDFLLPDSHHERLPPGRGSDPTLYERWLIDGFDAWLDRHPELQVRTFEAMLDAAAGLPSGTDAFGLGDVSLISLETDGTWHDLDVLKVAGDGATRLVGSVEDTSIDQVASSMQLAAHRHLLTRSGLCAQCRGCDVVEICGGGSLPHRFGSGGFDNPTIYCSEMKSLIAHVRHRLASSLAGPVPGGDEEPAFDLRTFELAETSATIVSELQADALATDLAGLRAALGEAGHDSASVSAELLTRVARRAGTVAWQRAFNTTRRGGVVRDVDGLRIDPDTEYLEQVLTATPEDHGLEVGMNDPWLRLPFGGTIVFEDEDAAERGRNLVAEALAIVDAWRPAVGREIRSICSSIQFVRDPSAHPDKIVSFSDDSVPGALFVSIVQSNGLIDPYDLADSLVHEYRHQKLYLLERRHPTTSPGALVVSPWREDLRPASGLLHAAFVFVELRRFWEHVRDAGPQRLHNRAMAQLDDTARNLDQAFATLRDCGLTMAGRELASLLEQGGATRAVGGMTLRVGADQLPLNDQSRHGRLRDYFCDKDATAVLIEGHWHLDLAWPGGVERHVDNSIEDALGRWGGIGLDGMAMARRRSSRVTTALYDTWTLYSWSEWASRTKPSADTRITILHLDDHRDLGSPRLAMVDGGVVDLITGRSFEVRDPASVLAACESGAVGMGSFLTPFLLAFPNCDVRQLGQLPKVVGTIDSVFAAMSVQDDLLRPGAPRPAVTLNPAPDTGPGPGRYRTTDDVTAWLEDVAPGPVLLHVDMDYFNNRYDGDCDWPDRHPRHDPSSDRVMERIDEVTAAIRQAGLLDRIEDAVVAFSPGFFPAEMWEAAEFRLRQGLGKLYD